MTKLFIIGADFNFEEQEMIKESQKIFDESYFFALSDLYFELGQITKVMVKTGDLLEKIDNESIVYVRRTRDYQSKIVALLNLFKKRNVKFSDFYEAIVSNLDKSIFLPSLESKLISNVSPTHFLRRHELASIDFGQLKFPCVTKPIFGRHGNGFMKHDSLSALKKFLQNIDHDFILHPFLDIEAEYRIFVVGDTSLGCVRKIPAKNSLVANSHAGAKFEKTLLPLKFHKESIRLCQESGVEIGGLDFVRTKQGEYLLLEINRCPEFRAFTVAMKKNVAKIIVKYLRSKVL